MEHLSRNLILLCYSLSCLIHSHLVVITMLSYLDKCIHTIEDGGVVNSVYFDFAKACNSLHHQMLLGKPESYGINRNILNGLKFSRVIVVRVNRVESDVAVGNQYFLSYIYINNLPKGVKCDTYLFEDDIIKFSNE